MISPRLEAYLSLERSMLALDAEKDPLADQLRDSMDPLWYALSDEEHALLDARTIVDEPVPRITVTATEDLYFEVPEAQPSTIRTTTVFVYDWQMAA